MRYGFDFPRADIFRKGAVPELDRGPDYTAPTWFYRAKAEFLQTDGQNGRFHSYLILNANGAEFLCLRRALSL